MTVVINSGSAPLNPRATRALSALLATLALLLVVGGCQGPVSRTSPAGAHQDSGPDRIPAGVLNQPDPVPRDEPLSASGNSMSYVVFGKRYYRLNSAQGFEKTGVASWYGRKFHGRLTASGEPYDMYAMTAAHKSLPLPTFARVTNLANNRSIIVRINDRGPFVDDRLIDLSYAAAAKLDMLAEGTAKVRVVALSGVPNEAPPRLLSAQVPARSGQAETLPGPLPYRVPQPILSGPTVGHSLLAASGPITGAFSSPDSAPGTTMEQRQLGLSHGHYLQLGAFGSFEAAGEVLNRVRDSLAVEVFVAKQSDSELYRVQAGPFESPAHLSAAQRALLTRHAIDAIPLQRSKATTRCC